MATYNYTAEQANADRIAADLANRASIADLAAAGFYTRGPGLPVQNGNAAGKGTPAGFLVGGVQPNCAMKVRAGDPPVSGVYRTAEQATAYRTALRAIRDRFHSSRQGRRLAALESVKWRARKLGCAA